MKDPPQHGQRRVEEEESSRAAEKTDNGFGPGRAKREPVLSQYHWNPHLSAFGLVALHLFRVPTARPGRPRINLLGPARPLRHWNKWQWPSLDLQGSDALENSVTHPAGSRRRMTPARWIVFAVDLHLGRLLPASGPGPLR